MIHANNQLQELGFALAKQINPKIKINSELVFTCSKICQRAKLHYALALIACNRSLTNHETKQDEQTENEIRELVKQLPMIDGKPIRVRFDGDPRGYTVKLIFPDGRSNTWGGSEHGIGVPVDSDDI